MNKPSIRSTATAAAWLAAGALGATVLTGFAFAAGNNGPSRSGQMANPSATDAPDGGMGMGPGSNDRPGKRGMSGLMGGPGRFGPGRMGPGGPILHGDIVVKDKDGKIRTIRIQSGKVTKVATNSITVASTDGFTSTWSLDSKTLIRRDMAKAAAGDLAVDDVVMVRGDLGSGDPTAKMVRAFSATGLAKLQQKRSDRMKRWQNRMNGATPPTGSTMPGAGMMPDAGSGLADPANLGI